MVEVFLVLVETADDDRHVPATLLVVGGIGIHDPLVAGHRDLHGASPLQEVYRELCLLEGGGVALRTEHQPQVLVVEVLAGKDFKRLLRHLSRPHLHHAGIARERHSVDHQLGAFRVRGLDEHEVEVGIGRLGLLALVGHVKLQPGRLAEGHAADALTVNLQHGHLNLLRGLVEHVAATIELCTPLAFVGPLRRSASRPVNKAPRVAQV